MGFNMGPDANHLATPISPPLPVPSFPLIEDSIAPLPITPPDSGLISGHPQDFSLIPSALHVISNQRKAVAHLEETYQCNEAAQRSFMHTISLIIRAVGAGGKVIFVGVGKSGKVAEKLVATFTSLSLTSCFLHPTEALHGDLGIVQENDIVIMLTFSGRTPELVLLTQHLSRVPLVVMTACADPAECALLSIRPDGLILPSPIHEPERVSFGLSAPTTSTTVAMALGDALALVAAEQLHSQLSRTTQDVFLTNHPGGAIGQQYPTRPRIVEDMATSVDIIPIAKSENGATLTVLDVVLTAVRSPGGWVRVDQFRVIAPRAIQKLRDMNEEITSEKSGSFVVEKADWISVLGTSSVDEVEQWIQKMRSEPRGRTFLKRGTILGIVDRYREVSAVLEIEDVAAEILGGV